MNTQEAPDQIYAEFFELVQSRHVFPDSKTFVDATALSSPVEILHTFRARRDHPDFNLASFVKEHFRSPPAMDETQHDSKSLPVEARIEQLWDILTREADDDVEHSSLIPLPNPYVVPGGRFREVYYWDSYFTMLGLADSGRVELIDDMVQNFAYLIDAIGFVPNGNRSYYCTRSQPPYFALMVELLAEVRQDESIKVQFLPQLRREYAYWMSGADTLSKAHPAHRHVVAIHDSLANRFWDDVAIPRQESYAEDVELAASTSRNAEGLYRDIRAAAESGWDFSARWLADPLSMATIRTTDIVPVDLNSLMYKLESTIAEVSAAAGEQGEARLFHARAEKRRQLLQTLFFDDASGMFVDLSLPSLRPTGTLSLASAYPLFFGIATPEQGRRVARRIHHDFLRTGGWLVTLEESGQQWDSPNGWAPMQWITYCGLERYGFHEEARSGATRWVETNLAAYNEHGRLLEKYDVTANGLAGVGGEYAVQDGFGWTNAVLLRLMRKLGNFP